MADLRANTFTQPNNTNVPLANGEEFTGDWEYVSSHSSVTVALKTDTTGILYMEFSPDGINADSSLQFNITPILDPPHRLTITRSYYRTSILNK